jgi:hypothetical protein
MKRRLLLSLVAAGMALGTGVASANADYWRANGLLLEVSADPRDGNDLVQVNPQRADRLELVALNARVDLRGLVVRFSDGRTFHTHVNGVVPGRPISVELPENCGVISSVELAYIRPELRQYDRTPARLQIIPRLDRGHHAYAPQDHYHAQPPTYQPSYTPAPQYTYRPRVRDHRTTTGFTGYIQGSFRF